MLFRPEGLIPSNAVAAELHEGVHDEPLYDITARPGGHGVTSPTTATDVLVADRPAQGVRRPRRRQRRRLHRPARQGDLADRPERRRQDDVLQHAHRRLQADRAARSSFLGEDVTGKPPHAITARGIGRTFQNIRLFQNMTALENVLVGMHSRMKANLFNSILRTPSVQARGEAGARARAASCSSSRGLRRKAQATARNLPYGDQRRLEVAPRARDRAAAAAARRADRRA